MYFVFTFDLANERIVGSLRLQVTFSRAHGNKRSHVRVGKMRLQLQLAKFRPRLR